MKIGILQTGHVAEPIKDAVGDYAAMFKRLLGPETFDYETWNVVDMVFPPDVNAADGWLITGSRHGAYEDHPFIQPLEEFIRAAYAADVPVVGICFGHQIVAQAMGGTVVKFPGGWSVGRRSYDWGGETLHLNAWHQDQVVDLPDGAEVLASNEFCANAALLYGNRIFTVQPHPEFGETAVEGLIEHRSDAVEPDRVAAAKDSLREPVDNARLGSMMARFFKTRQLT